MSSLPRTLVGAVDQGTSSTRFLIFDSSNAELIVSHQIEVTQIFPEQGWVEEDPLEILNTVEVCIDKAVATLGQQASSNTDEIKAIGITNQRESLVVWDCKTGKPLHNAIIWLDARTAETVEKLVAKTPNGDKDYLRPKCGLPLSTYFSAVKMCWLMEHCDAVKDALNRGTCLIGNVDAWLVWNLTGGISGGKHITDVTNASRTMLMNLETLKWDQELCDFFDIPMEVLPEIHSSSEIYGGMCGTVLKGLPISGILGDQQAALVGQGCFASGEAKNTYGTGCFMLYNTGAKLVASKNGLLTTVAYQLGKDSPPVYALEGSVAIAGAAVQWLRDNIGIIAHAADIEALSATVDNTHGCYFVPAFSGLFCPYWQPDARGVICGISQLTTKAHIARACLEAVCFQTRELLDAMNSDSGIPLTALRVDGGMTANTLLMQLQADIIGIPVVRPSMSETTALGVAMAAGAAAGVGVWKLGDGAAAGGTTAHSPTSSPADRNSRLLRWKEAVKRSMHWDTPDN